MFSQAMKRLFAINELAIGANEILIGQGFHHCIGSRRRRQFLFSKLAQGIDLTFFDSPKSNT